MLPLSIYRGQGGANCPSAILYLRLHVERLRSSTVDTQSPLLRFIGVSCMLLLYHTSYTYMNVTSLSYSSSGRRRQQGSRGGRFSGTASAPRLLCNVRSTCICSLYIAFLSLRWIFVLLKLVYMPLGSISSSKNLRYPKNVSSSY